MQLQQKHETAMDDRLKVIGSSVSDVKQFLSSVGQTSIQPVGDAPTNQKVNSLFFLLVLSSICIRILCYVPLFILIINN